jgi:hypothetical protein
MKLSEVVLDTAKTDLIIACWQSMRPSEPTTPEPVMVYPVPGRGSIPITLIRYTKYLKELRSSWWGHFYDHYQCWYTMITTNYNELCGEQDRYENPELLRLWQYTIDAGPRLHGKYQ